MRFLVTLVLLTLNGCAAAERQQPLTAVDPAVAARAQIETVYAARMLAFEQKDIDTLMAQVSPAFSAARPDGSTLNRDDLAGYIRNNLQRWVRIIRQSNRIESLRLEGGNAVLDVRQELARIQIVEGREAVVESKVLQTETWARGAGGWQLLSVRDERDMSVTLDGRPIS